MPENIVESKNCKNCSTHFDVTQSDRDFYMKISPVFGWEKHQIPDPTLCPECRRQRRLAWRNERRFYKRKCDATGKDIISIFAPDTEYKVYEKDFWWSDSWDAMDYGSDVDMNSDIFDQFDILLKSCPHIGSNTVNGENSTYTTFSQDIKDSYMCSRIGSSKDTYYSYLVYNNSSNCIDCYNIDSWENCYEIVDSRKLYDCKYCYHCFDSSSLMYCFHCRSCQDCFGCHNLENKKYHFFNVEYSRTIDSVEQQLRYKDIREESEKGVDFNESCENCQGSKLSHCKNVVEGKDCTQIEDAKYIAWWIIGKDHVDTDFTYQWEMILEQMSCGKASKTLFSIWIFDSHDVMYSYYCHASSHLFACVWLKNKKYCIFNKQYSKEEYEILVPKIIEIMKKNWEWWEFFPGRISTFWYNETLSQDYFPLTRSQAQGEFWQWSIYEAPFPKVDKIIPASKLPEKIEDIPDDILNWAIECEITKKPFRIIKQELNFYRKHGLPIPKKHPDERHLDRITLRNTHKK